MSYKSENHHKHYLKYHFIFVCKYRKDLLKGSIGEAVKDIFKSISDKSDFKIDITEVDADHIHVLVDTIPSLSPCQIARRLKQESCYRIWKMFPKELSAHFWNEKTFWTDGYFVSTIGQVSERTILDYIKNQG